MRYRDKKIRNIEDLIRNLQRDTADIGNEPVWFRGQGVESWGLQPSFLRLQTQTSEKTLMKKFKQNAAMLLNPRPNSDFDWLFIMQHHGVPTRLLDWSESPLVATYFAAQHHNESDGALWILLPIQLNKYSNIEPDYSYDIPSFEDALLKNYSTNSVVSETTSKLLPLAAVAPRNSSRMLSQQGVFTISHRSEQTIENIGHKNHIWRYILPKERKPYILEELRLLGFTKYQLFPELQSIGELLREGQ